jgi:hypothetical protein
VLYKRRLVGLDDVSKSQWTYKGIIPSGSGVGRRIWYDLIMGVMNDEYPDRSTTVLRYWI